MPHEAPLFPFQEKKETQVRPHGTAMHKCADELSRIFEPPVFFFLLFQNVEQEENIVILKECDDDDARGTLLVYARSTYNRDATRSNGIPPTALVIAI